MSTIHWFQIETKILHQNVTPMPKFFNPNQSLLPSNKCQGKIDQIKSFATLQKTNLRNSH